MSPDTSSEQEADREAERQCPSSEILTSEDLRWRDGATWEE